MPNDATKVRVASGGRILTAVVGTAAPADVTTAWAVAWTELGFASDDGVTITPSLDTDDISAWQSAAPVKKIVTGSGLEVGFTLLESSSANLSAYFRGVVTASKLDIPVTPALTETALGVEWTDGASTFRLVIPRAILTDTGEVTLSRGDAVGYEMTYTALPPATGTALASVILPAGI